MMLNAPQKDEIMEIVSRLTELPEQKKHKMKSTFLFNIFTSFFPEQVIISLTSIFFVSNRFFVEDLFVSKQLIK